MGKVYTEAERRKFVDLVEKRIVEGQTQSGACRITGIAESSYVRWRREINEKDAKAATEQEKAITYSVDRANGCTTVRENRVAPVDAIRKLSNSVSASEHEQVIFERDALARILADVFAGNVSPVAEVQRLILDGIRARCAREKLNANLAAMKANGADHSGGTEGEKP